MTLNDSLQETPQGLLQNMVSLVHLSIQNFWQKKVWCLTDHLCRYQDCYSEIALPALYHQRAEGAEARCAEMKDELARYEELVRNHGRE